MVQFELTFYVVHHSSAAFLTRMMSALNNFFFFSCTFDRILSGYSTLLVLSGGLRQITMHSCTRIHCRKCAVKLLAVFSCSAKEQISQFNLRKSSSMRQICCNFNGTQMSMAIELPYSVVIRS